MNFEQYIGLPYAEKGRDVSGVDCWGLVRLIYKNELQIDLPSFSVEYTQTDTARIEELIAQYKEGWQEAQEPAVGSIVLFRVFGNESHVGVVVSPTHFIHVRENQDSVIESLNSASWARRVVGYFNYCEKKSVVLNAVPHPLRTERYTIPIVPGTTLKVLAEGLTKEYNIAPELKSKVSVMVNGRLIPEEQWHEVVLKEGDSVEYRAVPAGSSVLRTIAFIAIAVIAPYVATAALQAAAVAGVSITAGVGAAIYFGTIAAVNLIGGALINAIAPIRPPVQNNLLNRNDPGSAERQLMVNGGSNQQRPYSAIPVVLGKVRITPPLGSNNFLTYENERDSYLSMLLVWGYGPMVIDAATLRIGDIPLTSFTDYNYITLNRIAEPTATEERNFNSIYGKDVAQVNTQVELTCEGNPEGGPVYFTGTNKIIFKGISAGRTFEAVFVSNDFSATTLSYNNIDNVTVTSPNATTRVVTGTITKRDSILGQTQVSYPDISASATATVINTVPPGPWFEAATDTEFNADNQVVPVTSATVALHFPQGLRRIVTTGEYAGTSLATPVVIRIEFSTNGGTTWSHLDTRTIGGDTPKKDGFTTAKTYSGLNYSQMMIRVRRETGDNVEDNASFRYYFTSVLQSVTFLRNNKPAVDPVGSKIAKTAFKIKATDQLNGLIQGISGIVQTYCKVWNGSAWVDGPTSNPAALMRYVLEHPANPRRVTNAASQINLTQLQYFFNYCQSKGFEYNGVLGEARSVLDVLRDICAAGRASPALVDGKWTVTIDEPKANVIQHFTPHNSWGFEGTKVLPKRPDGLRITFYDQDRDYQESEIIVYDIGKGVGNATLFESITLPGVTKRSLVVDHARWHMAQIKLRPEVYTLYSDIEYLVCNRGDRVKVLHDVPMWGLGSGRIKNRISTTKLELDEDLPMKAGVTYTIRFRSKTGGSIARNIVPKSVDGYYSEIDLSSAVTVAEADVLDLFLFGELQQEAQDLLVISIEPSANNSARITLVDYGVTPQYNIFTNYLNLTASTVFESQITLPPSLQIDSFGSKVPVITGFVSDESVMQRVAKGVFRYTINVAFVNAAQLPQTVDYVEVQYDLLDSDNSTNFKSILVPYQTGSVSIADVNEGSTYKIRMRYVGRNSVLGNWSNYSNHTVVGKTNPPSAVTGFTVSSDRSSGQLLFSWIENSEPDTSTYEIRTTNTGWGSSDSARIFYGNATKAFTTSSVSTSTIFYIKAVDSSRNYSLASSSITYVPMAVPNITNIEYSYGDTALTSATVTLSWNDVTNSEFDIAYYELTYNSVTKTVKANTITIPADWVGDRIFTVKTVDIVGKKSSGYSEAIAKFAPNPPSELKTQVIDNTVMLYWTLPARTSLPIDHVLIKKGLSWDTATVIGDKKGAFTTINETQAGEYTYWLSAVDTEGIASTPVSISTLVNDPPDFVFNGQFISNFSGTKSSATFDGSVLALPINTTETFAQHFTSRGWNTPQDQITAGYPIFIQPTTTSGYYEDTFDFGAVLGSSRVVLNWKGRVVAGTPNIIPRISLSVNNSTFIDYDGAADIFATNFRYVKVRVTVTASTDKDLYEISELSVRSDAKLKNDAGNIYGNSTDISGTIVNFDKEFIDVQSITVSPSSTTPVIPVYDYNYTTLVATYSVVSNICTVAANAHNLITGQKVRLTFSSGLGVSKVYTIASHTANSFTVAMSIANTSGNATIYPQSFRLYLFNNSGTRVSTNASWAVKGY
jgi:sulfur carrier protein ThiS